MAKGSEQTGKDGGIVRWVQSVLTGFNYFGYLSAALLVIDFCLSVVIIKKVPCSKLISIE